MHGHQVRAKFIHYFEKKGHKHVRSSSTIPYNDPSILFTNAGMNQFKQYFLGNEKPNFLRAVTSQKVIRAGGKHNDLENVGRTARHHTFFEMLGNFSFGDYFKKDAIQFAWEFLTEELALEKDKLAVSVFEQDDEAYDLWHQMIGIPEDRIARLGEKDNFWSMGDTGPCGPCSEIHYDLFGPKENRSAKESLQMDDGRYLEIWNLVFMQFNKDEKGTMSELPKPSIDTGMGLERITAVMQNKISNYQSDIFTSIIDLICSDAHYQYGHEKEKDISTHVLADHIRSITILIADGVYPSNEGRGYVLRRIIRRASRHSRNLGLQKGSLSQLSSRFIPLFSEAFPELSENQVLIERLIAQEEYRFNDTLNQGMKLFETMLDEIKQNKRERITSDDIFKLYDTYGFPVDIAADLMEENGFDFNMDSFNQLMHSQQIRAREANVDKMKLADIPKAISELSERYSTNRFIGYDQHETKTDLVAVIKNDDIITQIQQGDEVLFFLKETPFYAESGGQIGDVGVIENEAFKAQIIKTYKPLPNFIISRGRILSTIKETIDIEPNTSVTARVDTRLRKKITSNHSATHLMHRALKDVLGEHVKQAGSLVESKRLRFDFSHFSPLNQEQITAIEALVNEAIRENTQTTIEEMPYQDAIDKGAVAIFNEKYGDFVRVVKLNNESVELCGGTHVQKTGDIGLFKIILEQPVASGIRRIEAMTGEAALQYVQNGFDILEQLARDLKSSKNEVVQKIDQLKQDQAQQEQSIALLQRLLYKKEAENIAAQSDDLKGILFHKKEVKFPSDLKKYALELVESSDNLVVCLYKKDKTNSISLVLAVSNKLTRILQAGNVIKKHATIINGKGGGKANLAQCGSQESQNLPQFLEAIKKDILAAEFSR